MAELRIADRTFQSRLIIGTGGFRNLQVMEEAVKASGAEMATLALRRVDPGARGSIVDVLERAGCFLLPNTAGCFTARDAVATAQLARLAVQRHVHAATAEKRAGVNGATAAGGSPPTSSSATASAVIGVSSTPLR